MNKIDKFIEVLIEDLNGPEVWKRVFNKMTNNAKRQMLNELLNIHLGNSNLDEARLFNIPNIDMQQRG